MANNTAINPEDGGPNITRGYHIRRGFPFMKVFGTYGKLGQLAHSASLLECDDGKYRIIEATKHEKGYKTYEVDYKVIKTYEKKRYQIIEAWPVENPSHKYTFTKQLKGTASARPYPVDSFVERVGRELQAEPWHLWSNNCHRNSDKFTDFLKEGPGTDTGLETAYSLFATGGIPHIQNPLPKLAPEYTLADFNCYREWEQTAAKPVKIAKAHGSSLLDAAGNMMDNFAQGDYALGFFNAACLGGSAVMLYSTGGACTLTVQAMPDHGPQYGISWLGIF
ncbi:hypothetical protein GQ44DRAFT_829379 [Phaeosphaeriaceae sp. PMI808]|nr:hypothetical protein GQ44DRAFT_829379 [Phaeosphaeriaceae sp. PMI808]